MRYSDVAATSATATGDHSYAMTATTGTSIAEGDSVIQRPKTLVNKDHG